MKGLVLYIILYLSFMDSSLIAQSGIQVNEDPQIKGIMNQYVRINRSITHFSGWRITVISTADRRQMEESKIMFQKNFNYKVKWDYKEPYYQLKAGAFTNRNDAAFVLENVKKKFPTAFLSIDKIAYDEL